VRIEHSHGVGAGDRDEGVAGTLVNAHGRARQEYMGRCTRCGATGEGCSAQNGAAPRVEHAHNTSGISAGRVCTRHEDPTGPLINRHRTGPDPAGRAQRHGAHERARRGVEHA